MNIEAQIAKFDQSIEDFVHCVASLNKQFFLRRSDHWSPRDVVAHLIGWNRYTIEGSNQIRRGELPFYEIDPGEDCCKVNAVLILEYSSTDRQEMLAELLGDDVGAELEERACQRAKARPVHRVGNKRAVARPEVRVGIAGKLQVV